MLASVVLQQAMMIQGLYNVVALDGGEVRQLLDAHLVTCLLFHQNLHNPPLGNFTPSFPPTLSYGHLFVSPFSALVPFPQAHLLPSLPSQ